MNGLRAEAVAKDYIGDGVYVIFDGRGIWLHANDLDNPSDRIYLEPEVVAALERFIARTRTPNPA